VGLADPICVGWAHNTCCMLHYKLSSHSCYYLYCYC